MTTLLLKDLRLSLDVLRPWAMLVMGLVMGAILVMTLPDSLLPPAVQQITLGFLLQGLGACVALSAALVGASLAAALVHGDHIHGALLMMGSLPVPRPRRIGSKALTVAAASLAPAAAAGLLLLLGAELSSLPDKPRVAAAPLMLVGLGAFAVAIGCGGVAWIAASVTRSRLASVAIAILLLMGAAIIGGLGAWAGVHLLERDLIRAKLIGSGSNEFATTLFRCLQIGGLVGTTTVASCCLLGVPLTDLRSRSRRWFLTLCATTLALALLAGFASTPWSVATDDRLHHWIAYQQIAYVDRLSKEDLATFVRELDERGEPPRAGTSKRWPADRRVHPLIVARALLMRANLTAAELDADPLEQAFRSAEDFTSSFGAASNWLRYMSPGDPRVLPLALDAMVRFAQTPNSYFGANLLLELARKHVIAETEIPMGSGIPFDEFHATCCDVLIRNFQRMVNEGHAERVRLELAMDALRAEKARMVREREQRETRARKDARASEKPSQ